MASIHTGDKVTTETKVDKHPCLLRTPEPESKGNRLGGLLGMRTARTATEVVSGEEARTGESVGEKCGSTDADSR